MPGYNTSLSASPCEAPHRDRKAAQVEDHSMGRGRAGTPAIRRHRLAEVPPARAVPSLSRRVVGAAYCRNFDPCDEPPVRNGYRWARVRIAQHCRSLRVRSCPEARSEVRVTLISRLGVKVFGLIPGRSQLDHVIPPEVANDGLSELIAAVAATPAVRTALEIGSSNGAGSTASLVKGLDGKTGQHLYCLELSIPRFEQLQERYAVNSWVHCLNMSSIASTDFPSPDSIDAFYDRYPDSPMHRHSRKKVKRWLRQDLDYVGRYPEAQSGIAAARSLAEVNTFDLVLIDGSEFTGFVELDQVYGAKYILLDDILTFKNRHSYERLQADSTYVLICEDRACRNGYAGFRHVDAPAIAI